MFRKLELYVIILLLTRFLLLNNKIFKPEQNQESIFDSVSPLIERVLDGQSVSIFA